MGTTDIAVWRATWVSSDGDGEMKYTRVVWRHQNPEDPSQLYSELDDLRWELRKLEIFRDGRCGYASAEERAGGTFLGKTPLPELSTIAEDPQFEPFEITKQEFEDMWTRRKGP
jgi:hypothetical protein